MVQSLLTSNEPMYIRHFYSIFEELCNKEIDAQDRIKAIEEGLESADIEITANAFRRQIDTGGLALLKEVSKNLLGKIRILISADNKIIQTIGDVMETNP